MDEEKQKDSAHMTKRIPTSLELKYERLIRSTNASIEAKDLTKTVLFEIYTFTPQKDLYMIYYSAHSG
jgi:hypothetical protein